MWARVEFLIDSRSCDVPMAYFKDHEKVMSELLKGKVRENYRVFWSKNCKETPEDHLRLQGKILDVDSIVKKSKSVTGVTGYYLAKLIQRADSLEELLALCDSVKGRRRPAANIIDDSSVPLTKRKKNMLAKKTTEEARKKNMDLSDPNKDPGEGASSAGINPHNGESNSEVIDGSTEDSALLLSNLEDSYKKEIRSLKDLVQKLEGEKEEAKKESRDLRDQLTKLMDLNIYYQVQERERKSQKYSSRTSSHSKHKSSSLGHHSNSSSKDNNRGHASSNSQGSSKQIDIDVPDLNTAVKNKPSAAVELFKESEPTGESIVLFDEHVPVVSSDLVNNDKSPVYINSQLNGHAQIASTSSAASTSLPTSAIESNTHEVIHDENSLDILHMDIEIAGEVGTENLEINPSVADRDVRDKSIEGPKLSTECSAPTGSGGKSKVSKRIKRECGGIRLEKEDFTLQPPPGVTYISFEKFKANAEQVKVGKEGDSQFVKNFCEDLWKVDVLRNRSPMGKPSPTSNEEPKKMCSPEKKNYLRDLLLLRIQSEIQTVPREEAEKRADPVMINSFLRAKIKTLSRAATEQQKKNAPPQ